MGEFAITREYDLNLQSARLYVSTVNHELKTGLTDHRTEVAELFDYVIALAAELDKEIRKCQTIREEFNDLRDEIHSMRLENVAAGLGLDVNEYRGISREDG